MGTPMMIVRSTPSRPISIVMPMRLTICALTGWP